MKNVCTMVGFVAVVAILIPSYECKPGGHSGSGGYDGGAGQGYGGPKSSAVNAIKSLYNNQDGYNYNFGYDVQDSVYNNHQSRQESGSGDPKLGVTKGSYSVVEPDGSRRTVDYVADWENGFRATVSDKNGVTQHGYNSGGYGSGDGAGQGGSSAVYGGPSTGAGYGGGSGY